MDNTNTDITHVENSGGPVIPGAGKPPAQASNPQSVPTDAPVPGDAKNPQTGAQGLDIEALAAALKGKTGTEAAPAASTQELAQTGNPAIDAGVAMLTKVSGLNDGDMQRAIGKAIEYGDKNLIDKAFIKERFGEHAAYAELLAEAYLDDQVGQAQRAVTAAYDVAGGKESWDVAAQVFKGKAPEHLQAAARALANSGDLAGAAKLVVETCQSMGLIPNVNPQLKGGAGNYGALSAEAFSKEYQALRKEAGNRSLESHQFKQRYDNLLQRRAAGKRQGI
ncbi:head scaffolding protein [Shigella phage Buco]|uniref:Putative scaffolding protein n=1 Tax=Shigella phage Buco TaxID=2530183 RepID=A0A482JJS9_9CAUD|nr:head scaffolding protein [Shigella phage Buco]QBP32936.1 putative scaffolding protein [Shigella phage Buco]